MGISDYLEQVTKLTNTNLQLLKTLNDSLVSDVNHLSVTIDGNSFAIPSFISLENKVNSLQADFENLVNAPKTSEAYFTFDGDSRSIQVRSYENAPETVGLNIESETFYHESNNIFKDFLDPVPYLKVDISPLSDDITSVDIRKVVAKSDALKDRFKELLIVDGGEDTDGGVTASQSIEWGDINKILYDFKEGVDYVMYDTIQKLPIRSNQGHGIYVIKEVTERIDTDLNQHYTIKIDTAADPDYGYQNSLTYKIFDESIERQLAVGDVLVNGTGTAKLVIENPINFNTGELKLWNIHNGYCNLGVFNGSDYGNVPNNAILKFFSLASDYSDSKYAKVPLEEDQYIFVAVAPLNDRMNVRASWGTGLVINTFMFKSEDGEDYDEYYKNCVNIGDILNEISKVMSNTTTLLSDDTINSITSGKLSDSEILRKVVRINDHLSDNATIQNIESLYKTKQTLKTQLEQIQIKINQQQNIISTTNFQDTTGVRKAAENELISLNKQKSDLINSMNDNMQAIAMAAANATVPIDRAKYRIRGFVDYEKFIDDLEREGVTTDNVKGIQVQYQYVNPKNSTVGKALSFTSGDKNFLFSDWNELYTPLRPRVMDPSDRTYKAYEDTSDANEPSFNQFDIPITQGEEVNIKIRIVYDFGYPFIQMTSAWSDVFTVEFPKELIQDVDVVDIISENNDDIETNRFENILRDNGITAHIDDKINDQDKVYFHNPANISSGFYTEDSRRIIPLSDKLQEMDATIARLLAEIDNDAAKQLQISVSYGDGQNVVLKPNTINNILFKDFKDFQNIKVSEFKKNTNNIYVSTNDVGGYKYYRYKASEGDSWMAMNQFAETICYLTLTNTSNRMVRLFTLFPSTSETDIASIQYTIFNVDDYKGVYIKRLDPSDNTYKITSQKSNQIITFRDNSKYDGSEYYIPFTGYRDFIEDDKLADLSLSDNHYLDIEYGDGGKWPGSNFYYIAPGTSVYPIIEADESLFMTPNEAFSYKAINPGESLIVPILVRYNVIQESNWQVTKIMSFDIRTSLYEDPINYTMKFVTGYNMTDKAMKGYTDQFTGAYIPSTVKSSTSSTSKYGWLPSWLKPVFNIK